MTGRSIFDAAEPHTLVSAGNQRFSGARRFAELSDMSADQNIVYVLKSDRHVGRYYTGLTSDMERRLEFHNAGMSRHTSNGCPWRVVTTVTFADPMRAGEFEMYLKTGSGRSFAARHFR